MPSNTSRGISPAAVSTPAAAAHRAGAALLLGALGVVFGDIGTSPIYAFRETLRAAGAEDNPAGLSPATVFGVVSLIFWAVTLVVALKYVVLVMRADNQGEGGTMSLLSLAVPAAAERLRFVVLVLGLAGASLFFGDAMITPAISVPLCWRCPASCACWRGRRCSWPSIRATRLLFSPMSPGTGPWRCWARPFWR